MICKCVSLFASERHGHNHYVGLSRVWYLGLINSVFLSILFFIGVDEFAAITLKYSGERVAQLSCSIGVDLVNEAVVFGTKGQLKLPYPFWCSTKVETPTVSTSICTCTNSYSDMWVD